MIISAPRLFLEGAFTGPGAIAVEGGVITRVLAGETQGDVRLSHGFLAPGLIDLHNNGAFGVDCAVASPGEWDVYIARLAAKGVTSVLPTIITAPLGDLRVSAAGVAGAMARHGAILGMHLEGPFLSAAKRGAHRGHWLRPPDDAAIRELMADPAMRQVLRVITLAPELPGALGAIERLVAAGVVVSLGHTEANAAQMLAALSAGASMVTHVFNAQSPLHHRVPGAPGVALTDDRVFPCLITDGVHVDPMILKLAFAASPRAIAVTDSIVIAGMPAGAVKEFGGAPVVMGANGVGQRAGGTIVGAGITLDEGVRRLIAAGVPPEVAFAAATSRPAAALGLTDRGRIEAGLRADLVWWSDDFAVQQVWAAGTAGPAAPPRKPAPRGTEYAHGDAANLDERESLDIVTAFLKQEEVAQRALAAAAPSLASLADAVAARLQAGGRLFYVGAGTSGRLAMLDAMECGPTFGLAEGDDDSGGGSVFSFTFNWVPGIGGGSSDAGFPAPGSTVFAAPKAPTFAFFMWNPLTAQTFLLHNPIFTPPRAHTALEQWKGLANGALKILAFSLNETVRGLAGPYPVPCTCDVGALIPRFRLDPNDDGEGIETISTIGLGAAVVVGTGGFGGGAARAGRVAALSRHVPPAECG